MAESELYVSGIGISKNVVSTAVTEQIGVEVAAIDVYIDSLVFPKE